jgi:hypothetical protein
LAAIVLYKLFSWRISTGSPETPPRGISVQFPIDVPRRLTLSCEWAVDAAAR